MNQLQVVVVRHGRLPRLMLQCRRVFVQQLACFATFTNPMDYSCVRVLADAYLCKHSELVNFNGGRVQPQSLEPKHALTFRVEIGGHMVCTQTLYTLHVELYVLCASTCICGGICSFITRKTFGQHSPRLFYPRSGAPIH